MDRAISEPLVVFLKEHNALQVQQEANNWNEALEILARPLIQAQVINADYLKEINNTLDQFGPYFIIAPHLAIPHATKNTGVLKNGFSLLTLKKPIFLAKDERPISILLMLAPLSAEFHMSLALPLVSKIFSQEENIETFRKCQTKEEAYKLLERWEQDD